jgi:hypothetical protein
MHKVVPYAYWRDPATGQAFSIYTAWKPDGCVLETKGYTIAWSDGTSGTGRPAFETEAEAEAYLAKVPKGFRGMSMVAS